MMTETQIQKAASDDPGAWSKEVQWLAKMLLGRTAALVSEKARAEKAEAERDAFKDNWDVTVGMLNRARERAEKAEADVKQCQEVYAAARQVVHAAAFSKASCDASIPFTLFDRLAKSVGL